MNSVLKTSAYILAGGKSSRMGTDKGMLLLNGKRLVEHVAETLHMVGLDVTIVSDHADYQSLNYRVIPDLLKGYGPAGGVYTAMKDSQADQLLFCTCDAPSISQDLVKGLLMNAGLADALLVKYQDRPEPFPLLIRRSCIHHWETGIKNGVLKMMQLINLNYCRLMDIESDLGLSPDLLANINTPDDYKRISGD